VFKIAQLQACPHLVPLLASWFVNEWGEDYPNCEHTWLQNSLLVQNSLPRTFVAFHNSIPVGTARISYGYMPDRPSCDPWFGYLYIEPSFRRKGLAEELHDVRVEYCKVHGIKEFCVFLDTKRTWWLTWYKKRGWAEVERRPWSILPEGAILKYSISFKP
jgi:GNAT superfamily N-acetyltransferase